MTFKLSDLLVYLAMVPAIAGILCTAIFLGLLGLTVIAGAVIGLGEWMNTLQ